MAANRMIHRWRMESWMSLSSMRLLSLNRVFLFFAGADTHRLRDVRNDDNAVARVAGVRGFANCFNDVRREVVRGHHFDELAAMVEELILGRLIYAAFATPAPLAVNVNNCDAWEMRELVQRVHHCAQPVILNN